MINDVVGEKGGKCEETDGIYFIYFHCEVDGPKLSRDIRTAFEILA